MADPTAKFVLAAEDKTAGAFASVDAKLKSFSQSAQTAAKALGAFGAVAIAQRIERQFEALLRQVSVYEKLQASINSVTSATNQQAAVQDRLYQFAQRTGMAFGTVVEKYTAAARAAQASGSSQVHATEAALKLLEQQAATQGTVANATNRLDNALTHLVGTIAEVSGISDGLATSTSAVAVAFDKISETVANPTFIATFKEVFSNTLIGRAYGLASAMMNAGQAAEQLEEIVVRAQRIQPGLSEIHVPKHEKLEPIKQGYSGLEGVDAFEVLAERARARQQEQQQAQDALQKQLEQVRQFTLTQEEVELEATDRRLEILRSAHEQGLLDTKRYYELSAEVTKRGNDQLAAISARAAARDRALTGQKIDSVRMLTGAVAAALTAGGENSKKEFEQHKKIAIAAALIDTAAAAALALRSGLPPWNLVAAAAVAAAGYANVQQIKGTTWNGGEGGGGGFGGAAGSAGSSSVGQPTTPTISDPERSSGRSQIIVEIHVNGHIVGGREQFAEFIYGELNELIKHRDFDPIGSVGGATSLRSSMSTLGGGRGQGISTTWRM